MKTAIRIYALLLYFYPRSYRNIFGAQMRQTFIDHYTDVQASDGRVSIRFWLATLADEIQNIVRQYMSLFTEGNHFLNVTLGKLLVAALFFIPLYFTFMLLWVRLSLALPHPSVSGLGALVALAADLLILPGVSSLVVSYLIASTLAATLHRAERILRPNALAN